MEYVKINSLWKRQGWYFDQEKKKSPDYQKGRQSFILGDYAEEEFGAIKYWRVEEKVDGTNIRIEYTNQLDISSVIINGRTENAQIPCHLLNAIQPHFSVERMMGVFPNANKVILFGEGYGPKIQKGGGNYRKTPGFILFDVWIDGWWLKRENVQELAKELEIEACPDLGIMTEDEIVEFVKSKPMSRCSETPRVMEGIIARSEPLMLFRKKPVICEDPLTFGDNGPIMWKLKCKEF